MVPVKPSSQKLIAASRDGSETTVGEKRKVLILLILCTC